MHTAPRMGGASHRPPDGMGRMVVVIMGVAGAGKSTIGLLLAAELGWRFHDADSFHSAANIEKMAHGKPLTDADRQPWLRSLRALIDECLRTGENAVLACSALREAYRRTLGTDRPEVALVYLVASPAELDRRLRTRSGHFAGPDLLESQLETIEPPGHAIVVDTAAGPEPSVAVIRDALGV